MSIFKKNKKKAGLEPVARLQVGNYIIKEWGRSASPDGKVYNVPVITIENAALTWRVSVESSHSRYMLLQTCLHWADVSPDGSTELSKGALELLETVCAATFFMTTEDFMLAGGPDKKFLAAIVKAMKGYADRKGEETSKSQTEAERAKADAEALDEMQHPEKAIE